jgi:hypothetical protein
MIKRFKTLEELLPDGVLLTNGAVGHTDSEFCVLAKEIGQPVERTTHLEDWMWVEVNPKSMSTEEYLKLHKEITDRMHEITRAKNADYTGGDLNNPFKNLLLVCYLKDTKG